MSVADTVFHVSDLAGLNAALRSAAAGEGTYTIALEVPDGTLRLTDALLAVNLTAGSRLTIEGNGATLDGLGTQRGLMVLGGTVEIRDLAITHALARGGDGGSGFYGGGGGAGLGGGLFVGAAGVVTLRGVSFTGNAAQGGNGGDGLGTGAGGGGGLGGDGGAGTGPSELFYGTYDPTGFGGGGGIGRGATGGTLGTTEAGGAGIAPGAASGGRGNDFDLGGIEGGGGGSGRLANFLSMAGGGGIAGHDAGNAIPLGWGTGGYGGGAGGTLGTYGGTVGGFGGGGGGSFGTHGRGGWGGGGGGAARGTGASAGVGAGAGGVDADGAAGGGGLGGGGAIFVQAGGSLTVVGGGIASGSATGGQGGEGPLFGASGADGRGLGSGILLQGAQVLILAGTLTVADVIADAPLVGSGAGAGSLVIAAGGTVTLSAANPFAGGVTLQDGAVLALARAEAAGTGTIRFGEGAGTLVVEGTQGPLAKLAGLGEDDTILLRGIHAAGASAILEPGNRLRVGDGVFELALNLDAGFDLAGRRVALTAATGGGTQLRLVPASLSSVACFRHGTAIATPYGEVAVERLRIGDAVLTRGGLARRIRWIGRREVTGPEMATAPELRPVLLRRGALGPGIPSQDLYLSPQHAVLAGGLLIPAAALVNGTSILRTAPVGGMQYCHIELDDQALVLAEGAPCETFLDADSRAMFHNADSYALLDIDPTAPPPAALAIPRLEEGFRVEAVRRAMARRAGVAPREAKGTLRFHVERRTAGVLEGWAFDAAVPGEPVELDLRAGGEVLARGVANRYRIDLDRAELAGGRCGFRISVPEGPLGLFRARDGAWLAGV